MQRHHAHHREPPILFHLLHGRALAITSLATIQPNHHTRAAGTRLIQYAHGFANGRAGCHHIINDHHVAGERRADNIAALPVGLRFLAVEGKRQIHTMLL